jgi:hypothetical protein
VGKLVNGLGLGMCFTFAPLYIGENCFPELRGFFLVFLNWSITYGQFFAALTARWSETLSGNATWRVPIGMLVSSLKALSLKRNTDSAQAMVIPCAHSGHNALLSRITLLHPHEKQRPIKARHGLEILYGKWNQDLVNRRLKELQIEIAMHDQVSEGVNWNTPLKGVNLQRTWLTFAVGATQQVIGTSFIFAYFAYFVG